MRLELTRESLRIIPESAVDEVFLEEVLRLRDTTDTATLRRVNVYQTNALAYVEASRWP